MSLAPKCFQAHTDAKDLSERHNTASWEATVTAHRHSLSLPLASCSSFGYGWGQLRYNEKR